MKSCACSLDVKTFHLVDFMTRSSPAQTMKSSTSESWKGRNVIRETSMDLAIRVFDEIRENSGRPLRLKNV
ncbi:hypothetical protein IC575_003304 [Cucumis melo]